MIRNNPDLDALLDKAAAEMGLTAENVTPEHLTALRQVVEDPARLGHARGRDDDRGPSQAIE